MNRVLPALIVALLAAPGVFAGEYNKVLKPGDAAPAWSGLAGTDGKEHALADLKDAPAVVVVFTCNSCPVAVGYEDRVIALAKKYEAQKVAVVAISVNNLPADRLPKMTERAKKQQFPFAYLHDPSQEIARKYGATYTPEFFVLDKDRKVAYMGALDDKGPPADAKTGHVADALDAVLAGKTPAVRETLARGCKVRFDAAK